jgi:hypothetical protein
MTHFRYLKVKITVISDGPAADNQLPSLPNVALLHPANAPAMKLAFDCTATNPRL